MKDYVNKILNCSYKKAKKKLFTEEVYSYVPKI